MDSEFYSILASMANVVVFAAFLSTLVEGAVEFLIKPVISKRESLSEYTPYVSTLLGIVVCVLFGVDLVSPLATGLGLNVLYPVAGSIVSGFLVGRGSNYVHNILVKRN